jgi:MFS family permease
MIAWGTVVTLMGIVQNYHGLLIARLFLGLAEAGLYPGVAYYLTMWYCVNEIQWVSRNPGISCLWALLMFVSDKVCFSVLHQWLELSLGCSRMPL